MTAPAPPRVRMLRLCVVLVALFNLFALAVLLGFTPTLFTAFMFVGQPVFALALLLLVSAVIADLRGTSLL